jgi:hypothetical protein
MDYTSLRGEQRQENTIECQESIVEVTEVSDFPGELVWIGGAE